MMIVSLFCYLFISFFFTSVQSLCFCLSLCLSVSPSSCHSLSLFLSPCLSLCASHHCSCSLSFQRLWLCGERATSCRLMLCFLFCTSSQIAAAVHCSFSIHASPTLSALLFPSHSHTRTYLLTMYLSSQSYIQKLPPTNSGIKLFVVYISLSLRGPPFLLSLALFERFSLNVVHSVNNTGAEPTAELT